MNKFFCNIGKKLSNKLRPPKNGEIKLPTMNSESIFFESTNYHEIENIIGNMENKNGGNDNINAKTLKNRFEHLIDSLIHINNFYMDKAVWP